MAHVDAGKTNRIERVLFNTGHIHRPGDLHTVNTEMDWRALEKKHGITIPAATSCSWRNASITIMDTSRQGNFGIEVEGLRRVLDSAIALFSASQAPIAGRTRAKRSTTHSQTGKGDCGHGMGIVVEYAGETGEAQWVKPEPYLWDYTLFGKPGARPAAPDETIDITIIKHNGELNGYSME
jgi:hypothetical protein